MLCKYLHSDILECIDSILNNVHFLKYFIYHVQKLADIITSMVNRLNSDHMNNDRKTAFYYTISNSILYVKNNSLQTNDLKLVFVESLIETLSLLSMEVKKSGLNESSVSSFENVFYEVSFQLIHLNVNLRCFINYTYFSGAFFRYRVQAVIFAKYIYQFKCR